MNFDLLKKLFKSFYKLIIFFIFLSYLIYFNIIKPIITRIIILNYKILKILDKVIINYNNFHIFRNINFII